MTEIVLNLFSVNLVEQELWQREEKGLIGILPVREGDERMSAGHALHELSNVFRSNNNVFVILSCLRKCLN